MALNGGFGRSAAAVWQNLLNTFIVASNNRGSQTINSVWKDGLPNTTLVSDRWAAQLKDTVQNHQLCLAHLLRELIFLEESEKLSFATSFKEFIIAIFDTRKTLTKAYLHNSIEAVDLENTLNQLLVIIIDKEIYPKTAIFQASMVKYRNYLLPCLYNLDIPPDNNGSERAIRNIKVNRSGEPPEGIWSIQNRSKYFLCHPFCHRYASQKETWGTTIPLSNH
jgi:transposase